MVVHPLRGRDYADNVIEANMFAMDAKYIKKATKKDNTTIG